MTNTARTHEAAALATSILLANLLDSLVNRRVLKRSEVRHLLARSIDDLALKGTTIISIKDAIDFLDHVLARFPEENVKKNPR